MSWEAIGAVGEIVGAAAVVVSLLYLAFQIRNQNAESRAAAIHDFNVGFREASTIFTDGELAEIYVKANDDFDSLSDAERIRLLGAFHLPARVFEEAFEHHRQGRLDPLAWAAIEGHFAALFSSPAYQGFWNLRAFSYRSDFRDYVDSLKLTDWNLR